MRQSNWTYICQDPLRLRCKARTSIRAIKPHELTVPFQDSLRRRDTRKFLGRGVAASCFDIRATDRVWPTLVA
jgi:hypothetical protein